MRIRLGTPIFAGVVQQQNAAVPRPRQRCDSVHPLHFRWECSSPAERSLDMREAERAALSAPTIFRGYSSVSRAGASHAPGRRRDSFCPHHFCPCGVVQPTCLPLMQEITGAKPVRDASFMPPKHFERCTPLVWESARCNSGWGLHFYNANAVEPALKQVS